MTHVRLAAPLLLALCAPGCGDTAAAPDAAAPDAAAPAALRALARFDARMGQLPEGVAFRDGNAYVGFAPTGQIVRVDAAGATAPFAQVPIPPSADPAMPNGYVLGLAFDPAGNLYAAAPSFGAAFAGGVYRVGPAGGAATLFARDAGMRFPNGLAFDDAGRLLVADSGAGAVFRVAADGSTAVWASGPLLAGGAACGAAGAQSLGANGVDFDRARRAVYVTNSDRASVVRIPVNADGSAGAPAALVATDCARLRGADGLTLGPDGSIYVVAGYLNTVVRVSADGASLATVATMGELDTPASLAFGTLGGRETFFLTNTAFASVATPGATPRPALLVR